MSTAVALSRPGARGRLPGLAEAVAAAGPGGTVVIRSGVYRETLRVHQDVRLVAETGDRPVVLQSAGGGPAIVAAGGRVSLHGFHLTGGDDRSATVRLLAGTLALSACQVQATGGLAVHATGGRLDLDECAIRSPAGAGLFLDEGATGLIRGTTIEDVATVALVVAGGANPDVRRCRLRGAGGPAVLSTMDGRGTLHECDLTADGAPAVAVEEGGTLHLRSCRVHDTTGPGVVVLGGRPVFEDCELYELGGHGFVLSGRSEAMLTRIVLRDIAGHGVLATEGARASIVDCTVRPTGRAAIEAGDAGALTIIGGQIDGEVPA